jgi:hypothetical protein
MHSFKTACFISLNPKHWKQRTKTVGRTSKATLATKGHIRNTAFDAGLELKDEAPLELETVRILLVERGVLNPSSLAGDASRFSRRFTA